MIIQVTLTVPSTCTHITVMLTNQNKVKSKHLAPEEQHVVIKFKALTKQKISTSNCCIAELHIVVGAKVMLTVNVDRVLNGARGTLKISSKVVTLLLISFDHSRVGMKAIAQASITVNIHKRTNMSEVSKAHQN